MVSGDSKFTAINSEDSEWISIDLGATVCSGVFWQNLIEYLDNDVPNNK